MLGPPSQRQDLLKRVPLLRALPADLRETLARSLEERNCAPGEQIFQRGEPGDRMYLVLEGAVEISLPAEPRTERIVLGRLLTGDYFGELALLDGGSRTAGASAVGPTRLLALSQAAFLGSVLASGDASTLVIRELAARLRSTTTMLAERATHDVVREIDEGRTPGERLAERVATWNGSWAYVAAICLLLAGWVLYNQPQARAFDPYPFVLFNLVLAVLVVLQGPLLMMAQNRENQQERAQAQADYRVNLKNELAIERLVHELSALRREFELQRTTVREPGEDPIHE